MLCQFTFKNFQCFKDETTLDMQATDIPEWEETLFLERDGEKFLPLSVIYGPNGSGKSTVLLALYALVCKVMRPICAVGCDEKTCMKQRDTTLIKPFSFSKETANGETEFELFFRTDETEYQYILTTEKETVVREELYKRGVSSTRYSTLFYRNRSSMELKGTLKSYRCEEVSDHIPLLSFLAITHGKNQTIREIIAWFEDRIHYINYSNPIEDARITITKSERTKQRFLEIMQEMGLPISDYRVEDLKDIIHVYTKHRVSGENYELELSEESNGTIKVFGLLPHIIDALENGSTLLIDELDAKLHPLLLKYIVSLFKNPKINRNHAQLIFTSHDLSTMNGDNFRRDEIWFVAKGMDESSKLYSLVEFKQEEEAEFAYDKNYLKGRYGADPYFQKMINWEES